MKEKKLILMTFLFIIVIAAVQCTDNVTDDYQEVMPKSGNLMPALRATGSIQILWEGGGQNKETEVLPDLKPAFFNFDAHEGVSSMHAKGEISYQVLNEDLTVHREIKANVQDVLVDADLKKAWIIASVYYDSKSEDDDHCDHGDDGCTHDDEEGCSHEDDEGCTHDDEESSNHDDGGGCDGGCTHDDEGGCDGGCSHDDDESCEGGNNGGSGKLSGKNSRVGQLIAVKVHDGGTPGARNDGITWRWYSTSGVFIPSIENYLDWPHLCKKTIIEGNLVVHTK